MNIEEKIRKLQSVKDLSTSQLDSYWGLCLQGDQKAHEQIKYYYMKLLLRIKPLYDHLDEETFYNVLEQSVTKALDRGLKFQVEDVESYMLMASETYFKYHIEPETDSLHIPTQLIKAFSRLDEIIRQIPSLQEKDQQEQIELLQKGFEYPIFPTRLLFYSFAKWKNSKLRQVDIDLTVSLLPPPHRIEWEIFYEKPLDKIKNTIMQEILKNP